VARDVAEKEKKINNDEKTGRAKRGVSKTPVGLGVSEHWGRGGITFHQTQHGKNGVRTAKRGRPMAKIRSNQDPFLGALRKKVSAGVLRLSGELGPYPSAGSLETLRDSKKSNSRKARRTEKGELPLGDGGDGGDRRKGESSTILGLKRKNKNNMGEIEMNKLQ